MPNERYRPVPFINTAGLTREEWLEYRKVTADGYALRFYRPLTTIEYDRLAASGYAPVLRSKVYLTVGMGKYGDVAYAYAEVRISQYGSVIDLFDALFVLGRELEAFLKLLDSDEK